MTHEIEHVYTFHTDAGHGWLEVDMLELDMLGITDQISRYSYKHRGKAYLEEDCDASVFINAMESKGQKVVYVTSNTNYDSPIRNFARF